MSLKQPRTVSLLGAEGWPLWERKGSSFDPAALQLCQGPLLAAQPGGWWLNLWGSAPFALSPTPPCALWWGPVLSPEPPCPPCVADIQP